MYTTWLLRRGDQGRVMDGRLNHRLLDLMTLAGWSKSELARLLKRRARMEGLTQLSTDISRVRRWIEHGQIPRDPVPRILVDLFSERFGRVLTLEDLGLLRKLEGREAAELRRAAAVMAEFIGFDPMVFDSLGHARRSTPPTKPQRSS